MKLLTREQFREGVFERDNNLCVMCKNPAADAHHILERRLWGDGGYYIDNGASLCGICHIKAETTEYSCSEIREKAGIDKVVLPEDYYSDVEYTKWGDVILPNGQRMKGPLFYDPSVQKILKEGPNFGLYTNYVKYPRTRHLPFSEGISDDDRVLKDCSCFEGQEVVITEKMDGENTSIYKDYIHARSIDGRDHWSRSWVKNLQAKIGYELSEGWRIVGENLYAVHSIKYDNLTSYFYGFSVWDEKNICLSWDDTILYFNILDVTPVPIIYEGPWNEDYVRNLYKTMDRNKKEGFTVRLRTAFSYMQFKDSIAKFVRKGHVAPENHHWFFTASEKNTLIK